MKYAVEMGSGAMLYIQNFLKTVSAIQQMIGRYIDTQIAW
jgi:hypothetical protein